MSDPSQKTPLEFRVPIPKLPEGQAVTLEECERIVLERLEKDPTSRKQSLWDLAMIYSAAGRKEQSLECMRKLAVLAEGPEERARCYLALGGKREQANDFEGAVSYYMAAFEMEPQNTDSWYWINNNLGYSLVQLGRCDEAEGYLQRAVAIDQGRSNAFKNLGLALLGRNRWTEAADFFVRATQANAADRRSLVHLEQLVSEHPELLTEVPGLAGKIEECRGAVNFAAGMQLDIDKHWNELRRRQRKPWWAFWR